MFTLFYNIFFSSFRLPYQLTLYDTVITVCSILYPPYLSKKRTGKSPKFYIDTLSRHLQLLPLDALTIMLLEKTKFPTSEYRIIHSFLFISKLK